MTNWLRSQGRPCWICRAMGLRGDIDYSLGTPDPGSFEVDHLVPISLGGDPFAKSNVDAAHRVCNQWRKNRTVEEVLAIAARRRDDAADASGRDEKNARGGRRTAHIGPIDTTHDWLG